MEAVASIVVGVAVVVLAGFGLAYIWFKARDERRRQARLSIAFERAQAVRTRGSGLQGSTNSPYREPAWSTPGHDRRPD